MNQVMKMLIGNVFLLFKCCYSRLKIRRFVYDLPFIVKFVNDIAEIQNVNVKYSIDVSKLY